MSPIVDRLRLRWPAFADETVWSDVLIQDVYVLEAALMTDKCLWGKYWELGVIHLSAHLMDIAGPPVTAIPGLGGVMTAAQTSNGGKLKAWKTGSISETYDTSSSTSGSGSGTSASADSNLNSTAYGQAYLELRRRLYRGGPLYG